MNPDKILIRSCNLGEGRVGKGEGGEGGTWLPGDDVQRSIAHLTAVPVPGFR